MCGSILYLILNKNFNEALVFMKILQTSWQNLNKSLLGD